MKLIVLLISFLVLSSCVQEEENNPFEPKNWSMDHSVEHSIDCSMDRSMGHSMGHLI